MPCRCEWDFLSSAGDGIFSDNGEYGGVYDGFFGADENVGAKQMLCDELAGNAERCVPIPIERRSLWDRL